MVAICELCRRTFWAFFRVENEHLHNTQGYRRVEFIPLHFEAPYKSKDNRGEASSSRRVVIAELARLLIAKLSHSDNYIIGTPNVVYYTSSMEHFWKNTRRMICEYIRI